VGQGGALRGGRRETARLSEVATPIAHVVTTTPDEPLSGLLARMAVRPAIPAALHTVGYALVLGDDGALAGVLTPAHIARASHVGALYRVGRAARPAAPAKPWILSRSRSGPGASRSRA